MLMLPKFMLYTHRTRTFLVPGEKRIGSVPPTADSAEDREQLAESYGFNQLAKIFLIRSLLKISWIPFPERGLSSTVSSLSRLANYCCLSALFFVIGHDCAHKSFSQNKLVEDIVGTLAFLPLVCLSTTVITPKLTSLLFYAMINSSFLCILVYKIGELALKSEKERAKVKISLACVYAFMAVGVEWPTIIHKVGILGWMSTFTMVHHTPPHIPFKPADEWNVAQVQLNGNILCHDINVHIPHDMSPRIHNYNLCAAHESIQENWGSIQTGYLQLALVEDDNE
ncbi:LOW QUALITY PROTEIN: hypothetical protein HID58_095311, partial [Brassica napus]